MSETLPEPTEEYPVYDPADDPANFEPKPFYVSANETYEDTRDA